MSLDLLLVGQHLDGLHTSEGRTLQFVDFHWFLSTDVVAVPAARGVFKV